MGREAARRGQRCGKNKERSDAGLDTRTGPIIAVSNILYQYLYHFLVLLFQLWLW